MFQGPGKENPFITRFLLFCRPPTKHAVTDGTSGGRAGSISLSAMRGTRAARFASVSLLTWVFGALLFLTAAVQAEIYSWTDEQGIRHFSDRPPQQAADVQVGAEIPHDKAADKQNYDAYHQMLEDIAQQQREEEEAAEKKALRQRLEAAERRSEAAQKKAEAALKAAEDARAAASEKQPYREIYILPERLVGPRVKNRSHGFPGRVPNPYLRPLN